MEEVVIVGAGIMGLATAVALNKVGVRALMLERSEGLRAADAALTLFPNAWSALDVLGISDKLTSIYTPFFKGYVTDVKTQATQEVRYGASKGNGSQLRAVNRKVLLEVLAAELPPNTIRFSSKLASIETQVEQGSSICILALEDGTIIKSKIREKGHGIINSTPLQVFYTQALASKLKGRDLLAVGMVCCSAPILSTIEDEHH